MESVELDAHWDFADPVGSEARFRSIGTAEAQTQVARALGLQGKFHEGHATLDKLGDQGGIVGVRMLLERGRLFNSAGDRDKAVGFFERALHAAQEIGAEYYAVDAAHMIAICKNDLESHQRAICMAKHTKDPRAQSWDASLLNNLGWTHFDAGELSSALECFQEALRLREMRGEDERARIAKWCVARCLREMGQVEEALEQQYSLLRGSDDAYTFEEIGECLLLLDRPLAARPYIATAARLMHDDGSDAAKRRMEIGKGSAFAEIDDGSVRLLRTAAATQDAIWRAISTAEGLSMWLGRVKVSGTGEDMQLSPGTKFDLWINGDPSDVVNCTLSAVSGNVATYLWEDASPLMLEAEDGTVKLSHKVDGDLAVYAAAWHSALDLLAHLLNGGERDTFEENYEELVPEYQRLIDQDRV